MVSELMEAFQYDMLREFSSIGMGNSSILLTQGSKFDCAERKKNAQRVGNMSTYIVG